jgi:hypothetical protein
LIIFVTNLFKSIIVKKIFSFALTILVSTFITYGQSTIATIDRVNGPGPTATATFPNLTALGMTRTGVTQFGATGSGNFRTITWETGASLNPSKYIQWSVTADTGFDFTLNELDIRYRRANTNAPTKIQIFYSLDGFDPSGPNPSGFAAGGVQTYITSDTGIKTLLLPLSSINSGVSGTITFRLFAWAAANSNGRLAIRANSAWNAGLGISNPGIRLLGSVSNTLIFLNGTWLPNAPSASTGSDRAYVINRTYSPASNISLNTLTVRPRGNLRIPNGVNVTCNSTLLESNSTRYSSLILDGTLSGVVNYNRHVNGYNTIGIGTGNDLISAPLSGQTFGAFAAANSNIRSNPANVNQKLFGPFSKTTGTYLLWNTTVDGTETLNAGVGYRAASTDNGGFVFTGTVNKGTITNNIVNSGPQFAAYNLIGNPYPSYMNVRRFLEYDVDPTAAVVRNIDLMDTYGAIYGYDGDAAGAGSSGWVVYNLTTANNVNITPGQGFLVTADAAKVAAYDITFRPSMRRSGSTDDFILGRMANENNVHLRLQAAFGTATDHTDIFFNDNATSGLDFGYDATLFGSNAASKSIYTHLVETNTGDDLAIQALAYTDLGSDISIPLGINVPQGQQVTVSIAESDLPSNIYVYLEDNQTNTFTLLNAGDYIFTPSTNLTDTGRFFLRFSDQTLSNPDANINGLQIYTIAAQKTLFIKGQLTASATVSLYDIQGRMVLSSVLDTTSNNNQVDVSNLSSGVYVVKVSNTSQNKTQKIILK